MNKFAIAVSCCLIGLLAGNAFGQAGPKPVVRQGVEGRLYLRQHQLQHQQQW